MTAYERPSFSVAQSGRAPEECDHGWIRPNGECQFCGIVGAIVGGFVPNDGSPPTRDVLFPDGTRATASAIPTPPEA